jgi:thiamine-phosphate pyrophosphorylase
VLPARPFLYPIVDVAMVGADAVVPVIERLTSAGVRLIQLRAKDVSDGALVPLARAALSAAHHGHARLLVNDRVDIARIVEADGVHVGQDDLPPAAARGVLGPGALVGVSTHDLEQLVRAAGDPVDYVAFGPVFPTSTKADHEPVVGLERLRQARARVSVPLVAIGGITRANAAAVTATGVDGLAVISAVLRAPDVGQAVRDLQAVLQA